MIHGGDTMKLYFICIVASIGILFSILGTANASWGWDSTDDPTPFYHQEWGKWYYYDDIKVFMVQIDNKTSKYVFDCNGEFVGGWITYMPMKLN